MNVSLALKYGYLLGVVIIFFVGLGESRGPLVIAFILAYLVFPLVKKLEGKGVPRMLAVSSVFSTMILVLVGVLVLVIPGLVEDGQEFAKELPQSVGRVVDKIQVLALDNNVPLDMSKDGIKTFFADHASKLSSGLVKNASVSLVNGISGIFSSVLGILNVFLIPLFFFYVISDYENIVKKIRGYLPKSSIDKIDYYVSMSNHVLSGYIRGQMIVALCLAILYSIGLSLAGLKFGFLIGVISGLISIIPYAGFAIGFITSMVIALADGSGFGVYLSVAAVFAFVQTLEGFVITPKMVGDKVGLSALSTMLALIIGGNLLGLPGMLLGIPIFAIVKRSLVEIKN